MTRLTFVYVGYSCITEVRVDGHVTDDWQVLEAIQRGIDAVNKKATSRAQNIQKWSILRRDFSVFGGELGQQFIYVYWFVVDLFIYLFSCW